VFVIVYLRFTAHLRGGEIPAEPGRAEGRRGAGDKVPVEPAGAATRYALTEQGKRHASGDAGPSKKEPRVSGAQV
jgi:hypothetical protein